MANRGRSARSKGKAAEPKKEVAENENVNKPAVGTVANTAVASGVPAQNPKPKPVKQEVKPQSEPKNLQTSVMAPKSDGGEDKGSWAPPPVSTASEDVPMETAEAEENKEKIIGTHPRLYLNQVQGSKIEYTFEGEQGQGHLKEYKMNCVINGETFEGIARSKKLACQDAAEKALKKLHNTRYDPEALLQQELDKVKSKFFKKYHPAGLDVSIDTINKKRKAEGGEDKVDSDGDVEMLGKQGPDVAGGASGKKKQRTKAPPSSKNALMHLNELKPGTVFKFESQSGPVHSPVFKFTCEVNGQTFEGSGNSKKLAKLQAAENALRSFVQFPDASEAHQALGRGFLPCTADFTTDVNIPGSGNFSNFDNFKNGQGVVVSPAVN